MFDSNTRSTPRQSSASNFWADHSPNCTYEEIITPTKTLFQMIYLMTQLAEGELGGVWSAVGVGEMAIGGATMVEGTGLAFDFGVYCWCNFAN